MITSVQEARLSLYITDVQLEGGSTAATVDLYKTGDMWSAWEANWNEYSPGAAWSGGIGSGSPVGGVISTQSVSSAYQWIHFDIPSTTIDEFRTNPNTGFILRNRNIPSGATTAKELLDIAFSANRDSTIRPTLTLVVNTNSDNLLFVGNGTGTGSYSQGQTVSIAANSAPAGKLFSHWQGDTHLLDDSTAQNTSITVSQKRVSVSAVFIYANTPIEGVLQFEEYDNIAESGFSNSPLLLENINGDSVGFMRPWSFGTDPGYPTDSTWISYSVNVQQSGSYRISYRTASDGKQHLARFSEDRGSGFVELARTDLHNTTGSIAQFEEFADTVSLEQGLSTFRFHFNTDRQALDGGEELRVDWIEFELIVPTALEAPIQKHVKPLSIQKHAGLLKVAVPHVGEYQISVFLPNGRRIYKHTASVSKAGVLPLVLGSTKGVVVIHVKNITSGETIIQRLHL